MVNAFLRRGFVPMMTGSIAALAFLTLAGCSSERGGSTLGVSTAAYRPAPPDAIGSGPSATATAEYRFDAVIDPDVIAGRFTEVWARVYRPAPLPAGPRPP